MAVRILTAGALACAAGCAVGPDYHKPKMDVPASYSAAPAPPPAPPPDLTRWWETFHDPILNQLVRLAVTTNLDVRLAEARVREARAQWQANRAALLPTVDAKGSFTRSRTPGDVFGTPVPGTGNIFQAGLDAGWEIDVFGGTRRSVESARYALEAQVEARRGVMITLLGEVAQNYTALRGYQQQLTIVRSNLTVQQDTLSLQRSKLQAGIATDLDVANAEAQASTTASQVPTLETQVRQTIHLLSVLLDREPGALESRLLPTAPLPQGPPSIPPGLPSDLLRRRPDVRQAERQLAVATANIGVATADLYPKFNLTGDAGLESISLRTLANASSRFWSFGPTISWRVFAAGQIRANIRVQNARQEEAFILYRQAVLQSLQDVENALIAYDSEQVRRQSLHAAAESSRRAASLAVRLNNAGVVDFLNVLTAQQTLYQSELQLAQSDQAVATDLVALYKALGGGWDVGEESASIAESGNPKAGARE